MADFLVLNKHKTIVFRKHLKIPDCNIHSALDSSDFQKHSDFIFIIRSSNNVYILNNTADLIENNMREFVRDFITNSITDFHTNSIKDASKNINKNTDINYIRPFINEPSTQAIIKQSSETLSTLVRESIDYLKENLDYKNTGIFNYNFNNFTVLNIKMQKENNLIKMDDDIEKRNIKMKIENNTSQINNSSVETDINLYFSKHIDKNCCDIHYKKLFFDDVKPDSINQENLDYEIKTQIIDYNHVYDNETDRIQENNYDIETQNINQSIAVQPNSFKVYDLLRSCENNSFSNKLFNKKNPSGVKTENIAKTEKVIIAGKERFIKPADIFEYKNKKYLIVSRKKKNIFQILLSEFQNIFTHTVVAQLTLLGFILFTQDIFLLAFIISVRILRMLSKVLLKMKVTRLCTSHMSRFLFFIFASMFLIDHNFYHLTDESV